MTYSYSFPNKDLIRVHIIFDIEQISDNPKGINVINGITISILLSLFVQFYNDILS